MAIRIVIVGGGISGLATAYFLSRRLSPSKARITLFEASSHLGGLIQSQTRKRYLLEAGPDSFVAHKGHVSDLCRELGLSGHVIRSPQWRQQAYVFVDRELKPFPATVFLNPPADPSKLLQTPLLSLKGRLRAAMEPFILATHHEEESVADFLERRFGYEVVEKIAQPLVAAIFGGDPHLLSLRNTFPRCYEAEKTLGHLTFSAAQRTQAGKPDRQRSPFLSMKNGMSEVVYSLAAAIRNRVQLQLDTKVTSVSREKDRFQLHFLQRSKEADVVILATPAYVSATLLSGSFPSLAEPLNNILYAPAILTCLGYSQKVITGYRGTGFLVPQIEGKTILACTWVDQKFSHRCPPNSSLLRCFIGGSKASEWMNSNDQHLLATVKGELYEMLGIQTRPVVETVYRWPRSLPQYSLGHSQRVDRLNRKLDRLPGLYCLGNYLDGVGIPDCVRHSKKVAERIANFS